MHDPIASSEERAVLAIRPFLHRLCYRRWTNMESEDRRAEAEYVFLCTFRTLNQNSGTFLTDFQKVLTPYMQELNSRTPSRFYGVFSLDAAHSTQNGERTWRGYDFISAPMYDFTELYVEEFLASLHVAERFLVEECIAGTSRTALAARLGISRYELKKRLTRIGMRYLREWA